MVILGIDLATTHSCVSIYRNNVAETIANEYGNRTTESIVSFVGDEILVGPSAKQQLYKNPFTIYDIKRLIGRKFSDMEVQEELKNLSYPIKDIDNKPFVYINDILYSPEEISSLILKKMKSLACDYLNEDVKDCVISVPANYNNEQRNAVKYAASLAGLNLKRILNEPTAAALAYNFINTKKDQSLNILVVDLGGGTFDVTLLNLEEDVFEIKATAGNSHLGGVDFDNILMNYVIKKLNKEYNNKDKLKLKSLCETAKKVLSISNSTIIDFDDNEIILTRKKFNELCNSLFQMILVPIEQTLKETKIDKSNIDEIILVGGSTRILKVQEIISEYFNGKKLNKSLNPDETISVGCALQGAILAGTKDDKLKDTLLMDIVSLSLSVKLSNGLCEKLILKNSTIPTKKTLIFSNSADLQRYAKIQIYEGENDFAKDNNFLGEFCLEITPAPRGTIQLEVTFIIDANSILSAKATEKNSNNTKSITIQQNMYTEDKLKELIDNANKNNDINNKLKEQLEAKSDLENFIYNLRNAYNHEDINKTVNETILWLKTERTKEDYINKKSEILVYFKKDKK